MTLLNVVVAVLMDPKKKASERKRDVSGTKITSRIWSLKYYDMGCHLTLLSCASDAKEHMDALSMVLRT